MRIGCYICHCGINIAHKVRVAEVAAFARQLKDVAVARDYKFMCSDPGQEMIERDIHDFGLTRVVVASCSPRLHEKTFQAACQRAGLNPYMFQMASVREQVSWVTTNEDEATAKAKTLVAGAVNRVRLHRRLEKREVGVHPDILVVGGGIAGMQAVPITFCIDKQDRAPCVQACPAGVNVQGYLQMIKEGKYAAAVRIIMERIPLPGVLGRVCPHPCETQCRRQEVDEPVAIRNLKRFAADQVDFDALPVPQIVENSRKVAVIGSGPAGLTVAYDLRQAGYQVTVFEALERLGGMLRVGIPDYRLPPAVLDREIGYIQRMGVAFKTQQRFNVDFTLADLQQQGFEAVFLGIGAHEGLKLGVPGEETVVGVCDAVRFLRDVNLQQPLRLGRQVVVIGGGNVAMDAARAAKRLGAAAVTLAYRRSAQEMPAYADEIQGAREEGVEFRFLTIPLRILSQDNKVVGLECLRAELGPPDAGGRRRPTPVKGSEFVIPCDMVIPAIGQRIDDAHSRSQPALEYTKFGRLHAHPETLQTSTPMVFAGGDAISGPATVVAAIAAGHQAALGIQQYLSQDQGASKARPASDNAPKLTGEPLPQPEWREIPSDAKPQLRALMPHLAPAVRIADFSEEALGYAEDQARQEAARCLNCGLCCECMECVRVCEAKAIDHHMQPTDVEIKVGSIILATGYDLMNPSALKQYGYGAFPNVYTSLEFERLSNATGPTGGEILIRDAGRQFKRSPDSVAILHCIGSRDVNFHEYCSRVCCMYALKYAHLIKEKVGHHTPVYNFYIDLRCFGKGYEEFYRRCQEEGTQFIRGKVASIRQQAETEDGVGRLIVTAEDTLIGRVLQIPVEMVVLCAAMEARQDALAVGRIFGVNLGADGFFLEEHPKLGPLNTATDGVFLAGACQGPKDIPDTVAQASGAASKALSLATRGKVEIPSTISWIDPNICAGCQMCVGLCAYGAISFDIRRHVSVINEALCKGCGSCSGVCPSGAAQVRHFTKKQVFAELDGILNAVNAVEHQKAGGSHAGL